MHVLRKLLWPLSLLYAAGVWLRNLMYDIGIFVSHRYNTPTIAVGNLSLGGTGKTPMIEWLIRALGKDKKIAVLSRGYRRKSSGLVLANHTSTAADIGDEPFQIYRKFPHITVVADANRRRGMEFLEREIKPDVVLLDDAFQHRRVKPSISILLTTYDNLYTDDWYVPTGNLRDARAQAKRADLIVVTKCPGNLQPADKKKIVRELNPQQHQDVLFCTLSYAGELIGSREPIRTEDLKGSEITVVTGVAKPEPLLNYLHHLGIGTRHLKFADHHQFTAKDLEQLTNEPIVLTTEKDYVRGLSALPQAVYLEMRHQFTEEDRERMLTALSAIEG